jgi:type IV pilus assembly protein PilN
MIRINLLPHREEKRKERRQQFTVFAAAAAIIGALVVLAVHLFNEGLISTQEERNRVFKDEITKLDKEIAEIRELREKIDDLLSRKQVIENLQANRADSVHLFNELVSATPTGVYLTSIKQNGLSIALGGVAQSNARVASLMRQLEDSPFLKEPVLVETKAATVGGRRVSQFVLNVKIERAAQSSDGAAAKANKG